MDFLNDAEYVQEATKRASKIARAIAERDLQNEESLQRVYEEISNIRKQNKLLHNQLITTSNSQIDDSQTSLNKLTCANNEIDGIKKNFETINQKAKESKTLIDTYDKIRSVQIALANVSLAREWLARVLRLKVEVKELKKILEWEMSYFSDEEEEEKDDKNKQLKGDTKKKSKSKKKKDSDSESEESEEEGSEGDKVFDAAEYGLDEILVFDPDNEDSLLLEIHDRIRQLEEFRLTVFEESDQHPEFLDTFATHLSVIDEVSEQFLKVVDKHLTKIVDLAENDPVRLVRVVRIIERDEKSELEVSENPQRISIISNKQKDLKKRCLESIDVNIAKYFKDNLDDCPTLETRLDRLSELCDGDLEHIERYVVPCFPTEYNVLQKYVRAYDGQVRLFINNMIKANINNAEKAKLISWMNDFDGTFEDFEQYLEVKNYSAEMDILKADYFADFATKLRDWCEKVISHTIKPDAKLSEEDGCVYTYAPSDFFTFMNQAIATVGETKLDDLIQKISLAVRQTLNDFSQEMLKSVLAYMHTFTQDKICAHVNDCSKCINYTKELEEALFEVIPKADIELIQMDEVVNGFKSLAKQILKLMADRSYSKISHYFEDLFGKSWYDPKKKISSVQLAFRDLTKEFETSYLEYLEYDYISILAENILNKLVKKYMDAWILKKFTLKDTEFEIVKTELGAFKKFCQNEPWSHKALRPLDFLKDFLSIIDPEDLADAVGNALKTFPDMPQFVPEAVIKKCGKYKKKEQDELLNVISTYYVSAAEMNKKNPNNTKTFFSTYVQQSRRRSVFSRITGKPGGNLITTTPDNTRDGLRPPAAVNVIGPASSKKKTDDVEGGDVMDLDDFLNAEPEALAKEQPRSSNNNNNRGASDDGSDEESESHATTTTSDKKETNDETTEPTKSKSEATSDDESGGESSDDDSSSS